ncbi:MarR family winged helix-turn-helix transcriptional regulator [Paenibacillus solisilvae]|uniref:MarR family winged helix-turn-helix transcriptional regulator n=1 Tax=Paenibacillus solisilvae TaxID=2486751 RepID=A0ABW0W2Z4_9BACL
MKKQSIETIELELAIMVRRITSATSDKKYSNLDRSAYLLLFHISTQGSAGVKALAEEFHLDISTASRQAAALEQKGYVFKTPDPLDGRAYSLQLTELGAQELAAYRQARFERITTMLGDWTDEESRQFGQLLRKFNRSLRS